MCPAFGEFVDALIIVMSDRLELLLIEVQSRWGSGEKNTTRMTHWNLLARIYLSLAEYIEGQF